MMPGNIITVSERCEIRKATLDNADFIIKLLNQQSFIEYIGDKKVNNHQTAIEYIERSFLSPYKEGLSAPYIVYLQSGQAIGVAGFYQRPYLQEPDLGYAFLDEFTGQGLAFETCEQLIAMARKHLNITKLHAITDVQNHNSKKLLNRLGFEGNGKIYSQSPTKADCLFTYYFA
ncbi:GNAT family N-acetyltransferase [Pseudoalteromonas luteoviolacea]|uniref:GNAT family N-acetyltransferase n=1 Tax=Pseudoalteromonas luteoviolacea TaxID=43657 RepID=UPI001B36C11E|nr:GNAT family N-acetyltransferase [Pseudoalteromonas luteoviolacea]MBQ4835042.1 GNAT family N-acetyltransferase [Pseudoalteromonas luteoviolacea]